MTEWLKTQIEVSRRTAKREEAHNSDNQREVVPGS